MFDAQDKFRWTAGDVEHNVRFFQSEIDVDYYFKRSLDPEIAAALESDRRLLPLGLNYSVSIDKPPFRSIRQIASDLTRRNRLVAHALGIQSPSISASELEFYPVPDPARKVLFLARLWDPAEAQSEAEAAERDEINRTRVECIGSFRWFLRL